MQERLNAILDYLTDAVKSGAEVASREIPLLAEEIAIYGAVKGWVLVAISLLAMFGAVYSVRRVASFKDDGIQFLCVIGCIVLAIGGLICFCVNIDDAIKATFAPRLFILEYVVDALNPPRR